MSLINNFIFKSLWRVDSPIFIIRVYSKYVYADKNFDTFQYNLKLFEDNFKVESNFYECGIDTPYNNIAKSIIEYYDNSINGYASKNISKKLSIAYLNKSFIYSLNIPFRKTIQFPKYGKTLWLPYDIAIEQDERIKLKEKKAILDKILLKIEKELNINRCQECNRLLISRSQIIKEYHDTKCEYEYTCRKCDLETKIIAILNNYDYHNNHNYWNKEFDIRFNKIKKTKFGTRVIAHRNKGPAQIKCQYNHKDHALVLQTATYYWNGQYLNQKFMPIITEDDMFMYKNTTHNILPKLVILDMINVDRSYAKHLIKLNNKKKEKIKNHEDPKSVDIGR